MTILSNKNTDGVFFSGTFYVSVGFGVLSLDFLTKQLVVWKLPFGGKIEVIPGFFDLVHVRNPGAGWGIFANHTFLLGIFSLLSLLVVVFFFKKFCNNCRWNGLFLSLLGGGIAGNMVDRFFRTEHVVDFLSFHYRGLQWPSFNVADIAITVGTILLVVRSFIHERNDDKRCDCDEGDEKQAE